MKDYNGFTGAQRAAAGRVKVAAQKSGQYPYPSKCEACGQSDGVLHSHNEDYTDPFDAYQTCYNCHMMIHCRFNNVFKWRRYIELLKDGAVFAPSSGWEDFKQRFLATDIWTPGAENGPRRASVWLSALPVTKTNAPPALPAWARSAHWRGGAESRGALFV